MAKGPVVIEDEVAAPKAEAPSPAEAPPVPEVAALPEGAAMQAAIAIGARKPSPLARWFWGLLLATISFFVGLAAWNTVTSLIASQPILGYVATALVSALMLILLAIAVREAAAFRRLQRIDATQEAARSARVHDNLGEAREVVQRVQALYLRRDDTRWGRDRLAERASDVLDASGLLDLAEREVVGPLDQAALKEVQASARQVATVTALVPLALADVMAALTANLRMIRRIAEVYGGRSGTLGSWRLTRAVLSHLVATGAVAVGDDLLGSIAGGSILGKLSRRFGEGLINGALTVRVGVAAMEVCRPMPFEALPRPSVSATVSQSLTGLFTKAD